MARLPAVRYILGKVRRLRDVLHRPAAEFRPRRPRSGGKPWSASCPSSSFSRSPSSVPPCFAADPSGPVSLRDDPLVNILELDANILVEMKYATSDNFMKRVLYDFDRCLLRQSVALKLAAANREFMTQGRRVKCLDCYRPLAVQWEMWKQVPNPDFVADPRKGSMHNRGLAVDLTLADAAGAELAMPTGFDDFTPRAARDFKDLPADVKRNRDLLRRVMEKHGFQGITTEWWHFNAGDPERYPVLDERIAK